MNSNKQDFIILANIDWDFRFQRPQQIASELAALGHRVFYVSPYVVGNQIERNFFSMKSEVGNLELISVSMSGASVNPYLGYYDKHSSQEIAQNLNELFFARDIISPTIIYQLPIWSTVVERLPQCYSIYDVMDEHTGFGHDVENIIPLHELGLRVSDFVTYSAEALKPRDVTNSLAVRNAVRFENFPLLEISASPEKIAGYYGAISDWFDFDLIREMAIALPKWRFILGGQVSSQEVHKIRGLANVELCGEIPFEELAEFSSQFDVALIPFKINNLTLATNPVKAYEYAAMGLPIISTRLPEVELLPSHIVSIIDTSDQAISALTNFAGRTSSESEIRRSWAQENTWKARAIEFEGIRNNSRRFSSIVVLTYNNLDFTKVCLESISKNTMDPHEVIVVDNNSTDGTREFLLDWEKQSDMHRILFSDENVGFSAGNNLGLRIVSGAYSVLLNNDTEVTPGWLTALLRVLESDSSIGLVGPATDNSGNESCIDLGGAENKDYASTASYFFSKAPAVFYESKSVAFFCAAFATTLLDTVGYLDESFGIGFFEDDDYCNRVAEAGLKVGITFTSFVHHHMSASFNALGDEKTKLFERNKKLYESKWGPWKPHKSLGHPFKSI